MPVLIVKEKEKMKKASILLVAFLSVITLAVQAHNGKQSEPHNSKLITSRKKENVSAIKPICSLFLFVIRTCYAEPCYSLCS